VYICNVAGTVNFGAGPLTFAVGDYVIYSGSIWQRSSGAVGTVTSVAASITGDSVTISGSPVTTSGTLAFAFNGTTAQYIRGNGTLATFPSLTGFVPYTGASANVDLGTHTLIAAKGTFSSSGSGDTVGITHSSGSGIALNITKGGAGEGLYINKTSGSGNAATIIGTLNATSLVKSGGTSTQFLKADGSIDSNTYLTASSLTGYVPYTGATANVNLGDFDILSRSAYLEGTASYQAGLLIKQRGLYNFVTGAYTQIVADSATDLNIVHNQANTTRRRYALSVAALQDGDSFQYAVPRANGTIALTSDLAAYLPLAGGTMTGAIIGTTSTFTNAGSGVGVEITNSSTGDGLKINHSSGRALNIASSGSGFGIIINNSTASTSAPFTIQKQGSNVITLSDNGAANFSGQLTLGSTITNGTNTFTLPGATGTLALTSALSGYLPLTGGTLTGNLSLTSTATGGLIITNNNNAHINLFRSAGPTANYGININGNGDLNIDETGVATRVTITKTTGAATFSSSVTANTYVEIVGDLRFNSNSADRSIYFRGSAGSVDGNWKMGNYLTPTGATVVTLAATVIDVFGGAAGYGFMVRNTSNAPLLQIAGNTGAATFSSSVTAGGAKPQFIASGVSAGAGIALNTNLSGSNRRNWFIGTEENIEGDFVIKCSTAAGGSGNAGDTRFAILNSGNVGIGTNNPTKRLDIYDANTLGTDDIVRAYQNLGYNHAFYRSQRNGGANMLIGATRDNVDGNLSANISVLWNVSNNDMAFGTNNTERMRITSGGNLEFNNSNATAYVYINQGTGLDGGILLRRNNSNKYQIALDGGDNLSIYNYAAGSESIRITTGGNVEINGGSIRTGAPTNGTAQRWKLGNAVSGGVTTNHYLVVEINGQAYTINAFNGFP
jgi:hypothetical protein